MISFYIVNAITIVITSMFLVIWMLLKSRSNKNREIYKLKIELMVEKQKHRNMKFFVDTFPDVLGAHDSIITKNGNILTVCILNSTDHQTLISFLKRK